MAAGALTLREAATLTHGNAVYWAAFSPDGRQLATASLDNTARLWSVADWTLAGALRGHGDGVAFVDYLKDGRIVTASLDKSLKVWSAEGTLQATLAGHADYLSCAAVARAGTLLASGGLDNAVRLWDAQSETPLAVLTGHAAAVQAVAFARDGALLASAGDDLSIRLWDVASRGLRRTLPGHSAAVEALAFAPHEDALVSAGADGQLRFWTHEREPTGSLETGSARIKSLAFSRDGRLLAAGAADGMLRVYDWPARRELAAISAHKNTVYGVAFHPQGSLLATAGFDRTIRVWQLAE